MDVDRAAFLCIAAADARVTNSIAIVDNQAAGACNGFAHAAGVDVEGVAVRYLDSPVAAVLFDCQRRDVAEDEVDRAADRDAAGDGDVCGHDVPAGGPRLGILCDLGVVVDGVSARRDGARRRIRAVVDVIDRRHGFLHGHVPIAGIFALLRLDDIACLRRAA